MGLDTSHNAWHGAYSAFHRWRKALAKAAGLPPLELMDGFFASRHSSNTSNPTLPPPFAMDEKFKTTGDWGLDELEESLPILWGALRPDPALYALLHHSDCEGEIPWEICGDMADRLEELLPKLEEDSPENPHKMWRKRTTQFIEGLRLAYSLKENIDFH